MQLTPLNKALVDRWQMEAAVDGLRTAFWAEGHGAGLRPLMTAAENALLQKGYVLAVPETAVIDTGRQQIVYREMLPGEYEGVLVELGPRLSDADGKSFFPVLSGLDAGDVIVSTGSFLIDAETRLNPAAGSIYSGGGSSKSGQGVIGASQPCQRTLMPRSRRHSTSSAIAIASSRKPRSRVRFAPARSPARWACR